MSYLWSASFRTNGIAVPTPKFTERLPRDQGTDARFRGDRSRGGWCLRKKRLWGCRCNSYRHGSRRASTTLVAHCSHVIRTCHALLHILTTGMDALRSPENAQRCCSSTPPSTGWMLRAQQDGFITTPKSHCVASFRITRPASFTGETPPQEPFTETSSTRSSKTNMSSQQALSMNFQSRAMVKLISSSARSSVGLRH